MENIVQPTKIAITTANLGKGSTHPPLHAKQTAPANIFHFDDTNFPPRIKAMSAGLQTILLKLFLWQIVPGYDYYLWTNESLKDGGVIQTFLDSKRDFTAKSSDLFMYKNTPRVQEMLKRWWYLVTRYDIEDNLAMKKASAKFKL